MSYAYWMKKSCPECDSKGFQVKVNIKEFVNKERTKYYWQCPRCGGEGFTAEKEFSSPHWDKYRAHMEDKGDMKVLYERRKKYGGR